MEDCARCRSRSRVRGGCNRRGLRHLLPRFVALVRWLVVDGDRLLERTFAPGYSKIPDLDFRRRAFAIHTHPAAALLRMAAQDRRAVSFESAPLGKAIGR